MTILSVKALRTDNGGEFTSLEFQRYCKAHGIRQQLTTTHTPSQNGVAERKNRTIMEMARAMLEHSSLPRKFWAKAASTTVYLQNRCSTVALPTKTPFETFYDEKPSVSHLRTFGCAAHVHVPLEHRSKLDSKSQKMIFIGYSQESKAYRLYDA